MAEIIEMPRLSDTMTEGVIAAWHAKVGDSVSAGDVLAEVETDKATMDVESYFDGVLLHIGVAEGDGIPVGALLAIIGEKGEDVSSVVESYKNKAAAPAEEAVAEAPAKEEPAKVAAAPAASPTPPPATVVAKSPEPVAPPSDNGSRVKASPLAKAMAKDLGIDLRLVKGTGDNGRVIKKDIENYTPPAAAAVSVASGVESFEEVRVSQMRKTIARRLSESKFTAPHFYLTMEIDMDRVVAARKKINEVAPVKISYNDIVIKAAAVALKKHPKVNSAWQGDTIRINHHVHIGMAVAVDEGLLVPVIRFADTRGLVSISQEARELAGKARERKLQPSEWEGNTFTISNLGMYGIEEFTAIINPPDGCIMAVGGIIQKAVVKNGEVVPGHVMKVTLSCDHRVVDGATGSEFLVTFKQLLEEPLRIML